VSQVKYEHITLYGIKNSAKFMVPISLLSENEKITNRNSNFKQRKQTEIMFDDSTFALLEKSRCRPSSFL